jgi:ABC-type methionine transport system ATPase subunit
MDLLLKINLELNITMVMVSHNPDLETYADRVLYIRNGVLESQALNEVQTPLNYERQRTEKEEEVIARQLTSLFVFRYIEYLNSLDSGNK